MALAVKAIDILFGKMELMGRDVSSDGQPIMLGALYHAGCGCRRKPVEMDAATRVFRQGNVPGNRYGFRSSRYARQAKPGGHRAFMDTTIIFQVAILRA
jgi:hypothetical protein